MTQLGCLTASCAQPTGRSRLDAPGATSSTVLFGSNDDGAITGYYGDAIGYHGFVRAADSTITTFDGPSDINGTYAYSINDGGVITGYYRDATKNNDVEG